jgi:hypothetical protein
MTYAEHALHCSLSPNGTARPEVPTFLATLGSAACGCGCAHFQSGLPHGVAGNKQAEVKQGQRDAVVLAAESCSEVVYLCDR